MDEQADTRRRTTRWVGAAAMLAAGAVAGGLLSGTLSASASNSTSPAVNSSTPGHGGPMSGDRGARPVRSDEKSLPTARAATLRAAALKAVPGGTVYRIETDAGDGTYEAHMQRADGSLVTVKFGRNLAVTRVEAGMGRGGPAVAR
jgi:hypothetical protein